MAMLSKKKGKAGEKEVCGIFELHFKKKFYRTLGSGADSKLLEGSQPDFIIKSQAGDVLCEDQSFPWVVEVKRRGEISLWNILTGKDAELLEWIEQVSGDASRVHKEPLLMFRQDGKQWVFGYCVNTVGALIGMLPCKNSSISITAPNGNQWKFMYW